MVKLKFKDYINGLWICLLKNIIILFLSVFFICYITYHSFSQERYILLFANILFILPILDAIYRIWKFSFFEIVINENEIEYSRFLFHKKRFSYKKLSIRYSKVGDYYRYFAYDEETKLFSFSGLWKSIDEACSKNGIEVSPITRVTFETKVMDGNRRIIIKRLKSFYGCAVKTKVYVSDSNGTLNIKNVPVSYLGEFKHNSETTFEVSNSKLVLFLCLDISSADNYSNVIELEAASKNLIITIVSKPSKDKPFKVISLVEE